MSTMSSKKVIVIGSGVGGAGIAALLAHKGFDVTLLEKNAFTGGKATSFEKDGFIYDFGVHYNARGDSGPLGNITRKVGGDLHFLKPSPFLRLRLNKSNDVPTDISPLKERIRLALGAGVPLTRALGAYRLINAMLNIKREEDTAPYDNMRLKDYMNLYTTEPHVHKLVNIFCWLLMAVPYDEASAGEFMWSFSTWFNEANCSYPQGGFREIPNSFVRAMQKNGGKLLLNAKVEKVEVVDGKATGVQVNGEFMPADIVISNAGIASTIRLAGEANFTPAYVKRVNAMTYSVGGVTVKYFLDKKIFDLPIILHGWGDEQLDQNVLPELVKRDIIGEHPIIFFPVPSNVDPNLAPPGKQIAIACCFAPYAPEHDDYNIRLVNKLDQVVETLFPEIPRHTLSKMKSTPQMARELTGRPNGDACGLGQTWDQCGVYRPDPRTPIKNLYLVGFDAGGRGVGVDCAGDSALKVSEMVTADIGR